MGLGLRRQWLLPPICGLFKWDHAGLRGVGGRGLRGGDAAVHAARQFAALSGQAQGAPPGPAGHPERFAIWLENMVTGALCPSRRFGVPIWSRPGQRHRLCTRGCLGQPPPCLRLRRLACGLHLQVAVGAGSINHLITELTAKLGLGGQVGADAMPCARAPVLAILRCAWRYRHRSLVESLENAWKTLKEHEKHQSFMGERRRKLETHRMLTVLRPVPCPALP